ncbi:hypothetical protein SARC_05301 [Sphaeroforma arctica JP610]|uniref:SMP-LTD domain-containing protein n=1 Tax=Sphaeroforma arctica JP610 TaxID=667725 RepID=A0A0L0G010_9EUKA|nr:hypothetical protein SARC_05301 [Sphaeroforma arctica JP610]KNC82405.1 hypothetical protein SARC_05301 [Sphaeroforma arctica JP610]|eukprot:XP_014156307.1 hypothetical protein SARC_05301 [Sphaeroforma arctica JP610]
MEATTSETDSIASSDLNYVVWFGQLLVGVAFEFGEWIELFLGLTFFSSGVVAGVCAFLLPQLVTVWVLHVLPSIRRLQPWDRRKPIKVARNPWADWEKEYAYDSGSEESAVWVNAIFSNIWVLQNESIFRQGLQKFIEGELDDLYKESFGCFLEDLTVPQTTIGACFPTITNFVTLNHPSANGPFRVCADFSISGSLSLTTRLVVRTLRIPIKALIHISEITGKLLFEFNTFPEPTMSISFYPNVIIKCPSQVRICGRQWERLDGWVTQIVRRVIVSKFVLPKLKGFYLFNEAPWLKTGYVQFVRCDATSKLVPLWAYCWLEVRENAMSVYEDHTQDIPEATFSQHDIVSVDYSNADLDRSEKDGNRAPSPCLELDVLNEKLYVHLAGFGRYEIRCTSADYDKDEDEIAQGERKRDDDGDDTSGVEKSNRRVQSTFSQDNAPPWIPRDRKGVYDCRSLSRPRTELQKWRKAIVALKKRKTSESSTAIDALSVDTDASAETAHRVSSDAARKVASAKVSASSLVDSKLKSIMRRNVEAISGQEELVTQDRINQIQKSMKIQQKRLDDIEKLQIHGKVDITLELEIEMQREHVRALHTILQRARTMVVKGARYISEVQDESNMLGATFHGRTISIDEGAIPMPSTPPSNKRNSVGPEELAKFIAGESRYQD